MSRLQQDGTASPEAKFLRGGSVKDPLNLAALADADISSIQRQRLSIIIPSNVHDPLGLGVSNVSSSTESLTESSAKRSVAKSTGEGARTRYRTSSHTGAMAAPYRGSSDLDPAAHRTTTASPPRRHTENNEKTGDTRKAKDTYSDENREANQKPGIDSKLVKLSQMDAQEIGRQGRKRKRQGSGRGRPRGPMNVNLIPLNFSFVKGRQESKPEIAGNRNTERAEIHGGGDGNMTTPVNKRRRKQRRKPRKNQTDAPSRPLDSSKKSDGETGNSQKQPHDESRHRTVQSVLRSIPVVVNAKFKRGGRGNEAGSAVAEDSPAARGLRVLARDRMGKRRSRLRQLHQRKQADRVAQRSARAPGAADRHATADGGDATGVVKSSDAADASSASGNHKERPAVHPTQMEAKDGAALAKQEKRRQRRREYHARKKALLRAEKARGAPEASVNATKDGVTHDTSDVRKVVNSRRSSSAISAGKRTRIGDDEVAQADDTSTSTPKTDTAEGAHLTYRERQRLKRKEWWAKKRAEQRTKRIGTDSEKAVTAGEEAEGRSRVDVPSDASLSRVSESTKEPARGQWRPLTREIVKDVPRAPDSSEGGHAIKKVTPKDALDSPEKVAGGDSTTPGGRGEGRAMASPEIAPTKPSERAAVRARDVSPGAAEAEVTGGSKAREPRTTVESPLTCRERQKLKRKEFFAKKKAEHRAKKARLTVEGSVASDNTDTRVDDAVRSGGVEPATSDTKLRVTWDNPLTKISERRTAETDGADVTAAEPAQTASSRATEGVESLTYRERQKLKRKEYFAKKKAERRAKKARVDSESVEDPSERDIIAVDIGSVDGTASAGAVISLEASHTNASESAQKKTSEADETSPSARRIEGTEGSPFARRGRKRQRSVEFARKKAEQRAGSEESGLAIKSAGDTASDRSGDTVPGAGASSNAEPVDASANQATVPSAADPLVSVDSPGKEDAAAGPAPGTSEGVTRLAKWEKQKLKRKERWAKKKAERFALKARITSEAPEAASVDAEGGTRNGDALSDPAGVPEPSESLASPERACDESNNVEPSAPSGGRVTDNVDKTGNVSGDGQVAQMCVDPMVGHGKQDPDSGSQSHPLVSANQPEAVIDLFSEDISEVATVIGIGEPSASSESDLLCESVLPNNGETLLSVEIADSGRVSTSHRHSTTKITEESPVRAPVTEGTLVSSVSRVHVSDSGNDQLIIRGSSANIGATSEADRDKVSVDDGPIRITVQAAKDKESSDGKECTVSTHPPSECSTQAADKQEDTPSESADKHDNSPSKSVDKHGNVPPESAGKQSCTPSGSADKQNCTPSESADKQDSTPSESADKQDSTPSESADKQDSTPSESADKQNSTPSESADKPLPQSARYEYGNYDRYYGYRNAAAEDPRLAVMEAEWFRGKDVLDIGCNIGHITLSVARDLVPRRCVGVDIDASLVKIARKNVKHYILEPAVQTPPSTEQQPTPSGGATGANPPFPKNVSFVHANFVLDSDALVETVRPEYDVVLCLSVTKWVHLNMGDAGLRRLLKRMYRILRPGGVLILESQPWSSYAKRRKLTERIAQTYPTLQLRPEQFPSELQLLGFLAPQQLQPPPAAVQGFRRPLQLYRKPDVSNSLPVVQSETDTGSTKADCKLTEPTSESTESLGSAGEKQAGDTKADSESNQADAA